MFFSSSSPSRDYEIDREHVQLHDIIGEGQFGDVHKGTLLDQDGETVTPIAVKTCKVDADFAVTDKFLDEASKYNNFNVDTIL